MTQSEGFMYETELVRTDGKFKYTQINLSLFGPHDSFHYCYKPVPLVTPKMSGIVKETFTPIPKEFKISVTG